MAKTKYLEQLKPRQLFLKDKAYWAALVAALPFWALLYSLRTPSEPVTFLVENFFGFLLVAVVSPVAEEILFRGALQEYVDRKITLNSIGPVSMANLATSAVFAVMHGVVWANPWSLLVFFPSLVYGHFKDKTGSLAAPIGLHVFYNAGFFLVTAG